MQVSQTPQFSGSSEAWSVYAAVLTAYFPHLAPRLFHYQHFLALKSRAFQPSAWLRYDIDFRLKLAANGSWRFDAVDTELWATCFAADSLAMPHAPAPSCYVCQSTTHFYAQCPQRRLAATRPASQPVPPQRPKNPRSQLESGNPAGPHARNASQVTLQAPHARNASQVTLQAPHARNASQVTLQAPTLATRVR